MNLFKIQNSGKTKLNKTKQKKKIKERERRTYLASPVQPTRTGPAGPARHRYSPPVVFLLPVGAAACSHARGRGGHLLPAWLPPPSLVPPATPRSPDPLSLLPRSLDLPPPRSSVSPPATERSRRHRREPPWLPATPRLTDAPGSSAGPPSTSSTSHEAPDVPQHRPRCLLQPRDRRPSSSNSSAPVPPRAPRGHRRNPCELLFHSPSSSRSFPYPSRLSAGPESSPPPCLVTTVAGAVAARSRAHHRTQHVSRSP